jgi:hypothetical protein
MSDLIILTLYQALLNHFGTYSVFEVLLGLTFLHCKLNNNDLKISFQ